MKRPYDPRALTRRHEAKSTVPGSLISPPAYQHIVSERSDRGGGGGLTGWPSVTMVSLKYIQSALRVRGEDQASEVSEKQLVGEFKPVSLRCF